VLVGIDVVNVMAVYQPVMRAYGFQRASVETIKSV